MRPKKHKDHKPVNDSRRKEMKRIHDRMEAKRKRRQERAG